MYHYQDNDVTNNIYYSKQQRVTRDITGAI